MFYSDIPKEEIPDDIKRYYKYRVKPFIGQIVIADNTVVKLLDLIRDDEFDGEWCLRLLHFPSRDVHQVTDQSIIACHIIPLKGVITKKQYKRLWESWNMNEKIYPYNPKVFMSS